LTPTRPPPAPHSFDIRRCWWWYCEVVTIDDDDDAFARSFVEGLQNLEGRRLRGVFSES